ncbi:MAG: toxin [Bacteroidales bacterium]|nr:toxin [Bacteroidales bacterium]
MATKLEVQRFLRTFHAKLKVFDIMFWDDREKNRQALFDLDITPVYRVEIIKNLAVTDYSAGPIVSALDKNTEMWVFGKDVKQREVYIKISLGFPNASVICISFHLAEHDLGYPFKNEKDEEPDYWEGDDYVPGGEDCGLPW